MGMGAGLRRILRRPRGLIALAFVCTSVGIGATGAHADTPSSARYIVTFGSGVSEAQQAADIGAAGASDLSSIAPLNMHSVDASDMAAAALSSNADVSRVEADQVRDAQAVPSDPEYPNQWALSRIGWDQVFGTA